MKTDSNVAAYPSTEQPYAPGLTKREHFAALAMQGMLSNPSYIAGFTEAGRDSVKQADALIAALNEEPK